MRHRALLLDVLELIGGGCESVLELRFLRLVRAHRLPEPTRQHRVPGPVASRVGVCWERFGVVVELDGRAGHWGVSDWWADMGRDNALQLGGRLVLRFPAYALATEPGRVVATVRGALGSRGVGGVRLGNSGSPWRPGVSAG